MFQRSELMQKFRAMRDRGDPIVGGGAGTFDGETSAQGLGYRRRRATRGALFPNQGCGGVQMVYLFGVGIVKHAAVGQSAVLHRGPGPTRGPLPARHGSTERAQHAQVVELHLGFLQSGAEDGAPAAGPDE